MFFYSPEIILLTFAARLRQSRSGVLSLRICPLQSAYPTAGCNFRNRFRLLLQPAAFMRAFIMVIVYQRDKIIATYCAERLFYHSLYCRERHSLFKRIRDNA